MSKITPDEVARIASLANIGLKQTEIKHLAAEIDQIVGFVEQLQKVDTEDVEPTNQVTGLVDVWRADEIRKSLSREELLSNAPEQQDGYIKVKRVL